MTEPTRPREVARAGPDEPDLAEILRLAAASDEDAWRSIIHLYSHRVFALARSRRLVPDRAEEVAQSVFVTVATHIRSGEYTEQGRFEAWLFRIAINRVRDEIRKDRRRPVELTTQNQRVNDSTESPGADPADLLSLRAAVEQLGEADREIIELRHHAEMGFREIAELLAQPIGTVLARHHRALRKLKDLIERSAPGRSALSPDGGPSHA